MNAVQITHITKDYGNSKGIFDVSLSVKKGEVYGFLGPNGAGKTTTIRHLLGFLKPEKGECLINGMDCFCQASLIQKNLGYLAGEIAFPEDFTGHGLLHFLADMKGIRDRSRMKELIDLLELDPSGKVRKMSKGMKQKLGIINAFIDLILEEKKKVTTIFMSSHLFEDVERTCERTAIIRRGQIAAVEDMEGLKKKRSRDYIITLDSKKSADALQLPGYTITGREGASVTVSVKEDIPGLLSLLSSCPVRDMQIHTQSLEEIFMHYYGSEV